MERLLSDCPFPHQQDRLLLPLPEEAMVIECELDGDQSYRPIGIGLFQVYDWIYIYLDSSFSLCRNFFAHFPGFGDLHAFRGYGSKLLCLIFSLCSVECFVSSTPRNFKKVVLM